MDSIVRNGKQLKYRQVAAALSTAITCGAGVYIFHPAFHTWLLAITSMSSRMADTLGSVYIVLISVIVNNAISLVIFKDISLGIYPVVQPGASVEDSAGQASQL